MAKVAKSVHDMKKKDGICKHETRLDVSVPAKICSTWHLSLAEEIKQQRLGSLALSAGIQSQTTTNQDEQPESKFCC